MRIKIICEVEKLWINYDQDLNGTLEFDEIYKYLEEEVSQFISVTRAEVREMFDSIDTDMNKRITKEEMI